MEKCQEIDLPAESFVEKHVLKDIYTPQRNKHHTPKVL